MFYSLLTSLSNRFDGTIPEVTAEPGAAAALISGAFSERAVATERLFVFASFVVSLWSTFIHSRDCRSQSTTLQEGVLVGGQLQPLLAVVWTEEGSRRLTVQAPPVFRLLAPHKLRHYTVVVVSRRLSRLSLSRAFISHSF